MGLGDTLGDDGASNSIDDDELGGGELDCAGRADTFHDHDVQADTADTVDSALEATDYLLPLASVAVGSFHACEHTSQLEATLCERCHSHLDASCR